MKTQNDYPVVSIIVRSCNRPSALSEALESLRQQTYSPLEVVLVNDSPEPIEAELLRARDGCEVRLIHLRTSRGRSAAANAGLQAAQGMYIGFLDDDDVLYPDHVQKTVTILQSSPKLGGVYTDLYATVQDPDTSTPSGYRTTSQSVPYCRSFDREFLILDNYIPINAVLFHRECLDRIGYFDEGIEVLEDWDFWIRMALEYDMHHLCAVTGEFRIRSDETNSTYRLKELFPLTRRYIYRKHAERSLPLLLNRFLRNNSLEATLAARGPADNAKDRIAHLELSLQERMRELEDTKVRLDRYVNFPPLKIARRVRRAILGLPNPPPNP